MFEEFNVLNIFQEDSTESNIPANQTTVNDEKKDTVSPTPIIIAVKGLKDTDDNTKYVVATMGNRGSTGNDPMMDEQTEPLNKDHTDVNPKHVDAKNKTPDDQNENNNRNQHSNVDEDTNPKHINTEDNTSVDQKENKNKNSKFEEDKNEKTDSDEEENDDSKTKETVEVKNNKSADEVDDEVKDQNANNTDTDNVENKTATFETDKIIAVKSAVDEIDKVHMDESAERGDENIVEKDENSKTDTTENMDKDTLIVPGNNKANGNKEANGNKDANGNKRIDSQGDDDVIVTVAGKDDVDAASTYSLFMEKDFRYYFQHPYCRLFISYFVVFCNFLIYAEDPVAHSRKECLIPMVGNDFAFIGTRYPPNAWSLLKVVFWLVGIAIGLVIGKLLVHGLLFSK